MHYRKNENCLICGNDIALEYLNLGNQPLANSYHKGEKLERYPLRMQVCSYCWHSQLSVSVDPDKMFEHYLYISDTSKTLTKYFEDTTDYILNNYNNRPSNVLEIACNSGLLLEMFKNKGIKCVGVDPAKNIRELSEKRNLNVYVDYWTLDFSHTLKEKEGMFDLIMAFHVLPHVQNPHEFISACVNVLSESGKIFIQTSQCDMFLNNEFDVIYHEHTSYFTAHSIMILAHKHNLFVSSIIKTDIHGKSFLFSLQKEKCDESQLYTLVAEERKNGIHSLKKYENFALNANKIKKELIYNLNRFIDEGYILIGYGAAAKGNTLLNFIDFSLDYIIDDNEMKWDYLTPGTDIEICSIELLKNNFDKICFVPLAWNFYDEIVERIKNIRDTKNDIFVRYFPEYKEEFL